MSAEAICLSLAIAVAGGRSQQGQEYIVAWGLGSTEEISDTQVHRLLG